MGSPSKKIVENMVGPTKNGIVKQTTEKTLHSKNQATTSDEIVDNIL